MPQQDASHQGMRGLGFRASTTAILAVLETCTPRNVNLQIIATRFSVNMCQLMILLLNWSHYVSEPHVILAHFSARR